MVPLACRKPDYSVDLLIYAWHNREFVDEVERQLAAFVASNDRRRRLPAMPKDQRRFVQELAKEYRITTASQGQEPNRAVELFKVCGPSPLGNTGLRCSDQKVSGCK